MITFIYRSPKKAEMYLYLADKDAFDDLDESLRKVFGQPEFVMMLNLHEREQLARVDINKVIAALEEQGFFLQMPPKPEQLDKDFNHV
jgi:uncharacterized protein YcgL (UPF0745 family)